MGWLAVIFGGIAAATSWVIGQYDILVAAAVVTVLAFAVDRMAHRRALAAARLRPNFDGTFVEADLEDVPGILTILTFFLVAASLVVAGIAIAEAV